MQVLTYTEVVYYFCVFVHVLFEETHNGYIVPKPIIKQFPFLSQETQLHHGARKMLHHAILENNTLSTDFTLCKVGKEAHFYPSHLD